MKHAGSQCAHFDRTKFKPRYMCFHSNHTILLNAHAPFSFLMVGLAGSSTISKNFFAPKNSPKKILASTSLPKKILAPTSLPKISLAPLPQTKINSQKPILKK